MKSFEYVEQIATAKNQNKLAKLPTSINDVEDWKQLIGGLKVMINCSYDYIKQCSEIIPEDETPDMQELNCAGTNIQFATAQILATYNAYYDLLNKLMEHNKKINDNKA